MISKSCYNSYLGKHGKYSPNIIFKHWGIAVGMILVAYAAGFVTPNFELYALLHNPITQKQIGSQLLWITLLIVGVGNYLFIYSTLRSTYCVSRQAQVAAAVMVILFATPATLGWKTYVEIKYQIDSAVTQVSSQPTSNMAIDFSLPEALLTVGSTVSLFGVVYSLVANSASKIDYTRFQATSKKLIYSLRSKNIQRPKEYRECIKDLCLKAVDELENNLPYDSSQYARFVEVRLIAPILSILMFVNRYEDAPEVTLALRDHFKDTPLAGVSEARKAQADIEKLLGRSGDL